MFYVNWNDYINKWVLIKDTLGRWMFGQITEYDDTTGNIKIMYLPKPHEDFMYTSVPKNSLVDGYCINSWTQFRPTSEKWNDILEKWALLKTFHSKWIFGIIKDYDKNTNLLKILALNDGSYEFIEYQQASVIEAWIVDSWTKIES